MDSIYPNRIDELIKAKGLTVDDASRLIFGGNTSQLYSLKFGRAAPHLRTMVRIEALFGMPIRDVYAEYWEPELARWREVYHGTKP